MSKTHDVAQYKRAAAGNDLLEGIEDISEFSGMTLKQTAHFIEQGLLPAFRLGRRFYMQKSTYRAFSKAVKAEIAKRGLIIPSAAGRDRSPGSDTSI